jgi:hypothetical protein
MAYGMPVTAGDVPDAFGLLSGIVIHPDTAKVEGFFVTVRVGMFSSMQLYLSTLDIQRWGTSVVARSIDALAPVDEVIRVQQLLEEERPILGQQIRTKAGATIGRCMDLQFDTTHFMMEWIFPKRFFRWGIALPSSDILEVRRDAIIVRDPLPAIEQEAPTPADEPGMLPSVPEAA